MKRKVINAPIVVCDEMGRLSNKGIGISAKFDSVENPLIAITKVGKFERVVKSELELM
jgi:hypothetical protein